MGLGGFFYAPMPEETPDYLRDVEPLPAWALRLIDASETRVLTSRAEALVAEAIAAAASRVRSMRVDRDGRD